MKLSEFNNQFLTNFLEKISFEKKIIVLLGDFNANLIHYDLDRDDSDFLDLMYSDTFLPQITTPSCITSKSATLTDNIFVNEYGTTSLSGNLTISLHDHLALFLIISSVKKKNQLANNGPKLHSNMKTIDLKKDYFFTLLKNVNWKRKLAVNLNNANTSTELPLDSVTEVLNTIGH